MNRSVLKTFLMLVLFNQFIFINLFSISMTYEYDTSGNLLEIRNEEISFFFDYDILNRLNSIKFSPDKKIDFFYDAKGRCISMVDFHGATNYEYSIFGHLAAQSPQPLHFVSSTYRGFLIMETIKFPAFPETFLTSDSVNNLIFGFLYTATILGAKTHKLQSFWGYNLSNWAI